MFIGERVELRGCVHTASGNDAFVKRARMASGSPQRGLEAGWMDSPAHRKVILTSIFRDVGVGALTASDGQVYFTLDMGRRKR